jgi:hypothetical protein
MNEGNGIMALPPAIWLLILLPLLTAEASSRTVTVGVYHNPPKISVNGDGAASGFFADVTQEIARRAGWEIEYVPGTWGECLDRLESDRIDLMVDVAWSPSRAERFSFGHMPVLSDWFGIYAAPGVEILSTSDLEGLRVAVLRGSIQHEVLETMLREGGMDFTILPCSTFRHSFAAVASGDAEVALSNRYFAIEQADSFGLVETPVVFHPTRLHYAAPPGRRALLDVTDRHLVAMMSDKDSEYFRALERWFGESRKGGLPGYVPWFLGTAAALILLSLTLYLLTRWQVRARTRELDAKNRRLTQALADLGEARAMLARQEGLRLLGTMVSGIAHDLNNILSVITGNVDLALSDGCVGSNEGLKQRLLRVREACSDGAELVSRMRAFHSRGAGGCSGEVDGAGLVRFVVGLIQPRLATVQMEENRSIALKTDLTEDARLCGSPAELREMLLNLLVNAVDAIEGDGTIRIVAEKDGGRLALRVIDDGEGMTPDVLEECSQPFFTTKGERGTGMGLAMVRSIVEEHGGSLSIDSEPGRGTAVEVTLPLAEDRANEDEVGQFRSESPTSARILAVDDDPGCLEVLRSLLELDGHTVHALSSPTEALKSFRPGAYDGAILDRLMPAMTGLELAARLREMDPDMPIAMLAGYVSDSEELKQGPVDAVRQKPLDLQGLRGLLAELL